MATSSQTYDVFLCHDAQDDLSTMDLGKKLRYRGLRPWLDAWSSVPGSPAAREARFAVSASRLVVYALGGSGIGHWVQRDSGLDGEDVPPFESAVILMPGCPLSPSDVPEDIARRGIVDMRHGWDGKRQWTNLARTIARTAAESASTVDPTRSLEISSLTRRTIESYDQISDKSIKNSLAEPIEALRAE